ncbi:MAG: hypothetical protein IKF29_00640 [Oceanobacillus sp.]|nr:hypothetical protein [Oceanobacillus sp.]
MAVIKGYFFNALKSGDTYDRLYNNDDIRKYFDKLIGNGVFPNPSDQLKVVPNGLMTIKILPGQAWINGYKMVIELDGNTNIDTGYVPENVTLEAGKNYRVYALANESSRAMEISVVEAVGSTSIANSLVLADISIPNDATSVEASMITDRRGDPNLCPWVAGLITQVDPSQMIADLQATLTQYTSEYQLLLESMLLWQQQQQEEFDEWFLSLQHGLPISADLVQYHKIVQGNDDTSNSTIPLDMLEYVYDRHDLIMVTMNGLKLTSGYDYTLNANVNPVTITLNTNITSGNVLDILVIKSSLQSSADGIVTLITGNTFVHIPDAIFNEALRKLDLTNPVQGTNSVAITNRNFARVDIFEDTTVSNVAFEKTLDGKISITGYTEDSPVYVSIPLPTNKGCFVPGETYNLSINGDSLVAEDLISVYVSIDGTRYTANKTTSSVAFTIPSEFTSITMIVAVEGINRSDINTTLEIQLEYGGHATEWVANVYNEYPVDGVTLPVMYDIINNIWVITEGASGLRAAYFVINSTSSGDNVLYPLNS